MYCAAQKMVFKQNEFNIGLHINWPFASLANYNIFGSGLQMQYAKPFAINKTTGYTISITANGFVSNNMYYFNPIGNLEARTTQDAFVGDISFGIQKILIKKLTTSLQLGIGGSNKNTSDAPKYFFFSIKPIIGFRINKHFELYTLFHYGAAVEDDYVYLNVGLKYIF
jgi:hypothetical protein